MKSSQMHARYRQTWTEHRIGNFIRRQNMLPREPYPSDITDGQWQRIAPAIPGEKPRGRLRDTNLRDVVNAINYRWRTGCVWRMLPHDFPPWTTVYTYFRSWQRDGTMQRIRAELIRPRRRAG